MAYISERTVRQAALEETRRRGNFTDASRILKEAVEASSSSQTFDIFLCHSILDAEIVLGAKRILESRKFSVYVDWIVDPKMDRSAVTPATAEVLRNRMRNSRSLFYLYSDSSTRSRWMPWELGFFDGLRGAVAIVPIEPEAGKLNFKKEEYLGLYPKVELEDSHIFINRTADRPVSADDKNNYRDFENWVKNPTALRM